MVLDGIGICTLSAFSGDKRYRCPSYTHCLWPARPDVSLGNSPSTHCSNVHSAIVSKVRHPQPRSSSYASPEMQIVDEVPVQGRYVRDQGSHKGSPPICLRNHVCLLGVDDSGVRGPPSGVYRNNKFVNAGGTSLVVEY